MSLFVFNDQFFLAFALRKMEVPVWCDQFFLAFALRKMEVPVWYEKLFEYSVSNILVCSFCPGDSSEGSHPFSFRTRQLSPLEAMVVERRE